MLKILHLSNEAIILTESLPKCFNALSRKDRGIIAKKLVDLGFDLQNLSYTETVVKSNRDKLLKDRNTILVFYKNETDVVISVGGNVIYDVAVGGIYKDGRLNGTWKDLLSKSKTVYAIQITEADRENLRQKQIARKRALDGSITTLDLGVDNLIGRSKYKDRPFRPYVLDIGSKQADKSGYSSNVHTRLIQRYANNPNKLIAKLEAFNKLVNTVDTKLAISFDKDIVKFKNYVMTYKIGKRSIDIPSLFGDVKKLLIKVERISKKTGISFKDIK